MRRLDFETRKSFVFSLFMKFGTDEDSYEVFVVSA